MKITVIGSGYVGLVTGACLAELGNHVMCLDVDKAKINLLDSGEVPIYEPGLKELIENNRHYGRISFTTNIQQAVAHGEIQFIAVGTPPGEDGSADLQYVLKVAQDLGGYIQGFKVIVNKSTVPVGTADLVRLEIAKQLAARGLPVENFSVVSNPEFLKEGAAIDDFMRPDRIVIGTYADASGVAAKELMRKLYSPFNRNHERTYYMDVKSAELTKYAANAMLATRISFMNEMANLADELGADIESVRQGIGSDSRIGYSFLYAGTGYGGSCFPKDVSALATVARRHNKPLCLLEAVEAVNQEQKHVLVKKIVSVYGDDLSHKHFTIWGLSFKPNTDDMREAPSRVIIKNLLMRGAKVSVYDPVAISEARRVIQDDLIEMPELLTKLHYCEDPVLATQESDGLVIVTEWKSFRSPDFQLLKQKMNRAIIFDGRNLYDPALMNELGIQYYGIGRSGQPQSVELTYAKALMNHTTTTRPVDLNLYSGLSN
jgi:UDPglucose 6-dehydrogenase